MLSEQVTPFSKNRVKSLGFFLILYGVVKKKNTKEKV
jgi:hypothetical protein